MTSSDASLFYSAFIAVSARWCLLLILLLTLFAPAGEARGEQQQGGPATLKIFVPAPPLVLAAEAGVIAAHQPLRGGHVLRLTSPVPPGTTKLYVNTALLPAGQYHAKRPLPCRSILPALAPVRTYSYILPAARGFIFFPLPPPFSC